MAANGEARMSGRHAIPLQLIQEPPLITHVPVPCRHLRGAGSSIHKHHPERDGSVVKWATKDYK